jgi:hypothetical protein
LDDDWWCEKPSSVDRFIDEELKNVRCNVLGKVRELQGYEPDYGETMTTQSDGRWVEREEVIKLLEKHFA